MTGIFRLRARLVRGVAIGAVCGALVLGTGTGPALAEVNTLEQALIRAYSTNPTLLAQRAQVRATDENVALAHAAWRPQISANASYTTADTTGDEIDFRADPNNPGQTLQTTIQGGDTTDTTQFGVQGQMDIFRGGRNWNEVSQAKANVRANRAQLRAVEQQVLLDAVTAYMDVLRDEAVLRLSQNNVQVLTRQLEAAQDRRRVGEITRTDVAQAEARLSGAQANLISSEAQLTASRAAFERVIGEMPGVLQSPPVLPPLPDTEQAARETALRKNPQLKSARRAEEASRLGISVATGALLPTVSLQASYQDTNNDIDNDLESRFSGAFDSRTTSLTAQVTMPLYAGGANYAQIRQSKQLNSEDRLQVIEAERNVVEAVTNAWEGLRSARSTIEAARKQVQANEIAFEGVQQEAQVGNRTTLDVLDAEQELLDSRVTLVRSERDEYVAGFQLLSSIGLLSAEDLRLNTSIYDPGVHYDDVKGRWIGWWSRDE